NVGAGNRRGKKYTISDEEAPGSMIVTKKSLPRRTFLRGIGASLALPLLDSMVPALAATAGAKPALRLAFVYHPVGMIMSRWTPSAEGSAFEFTPTMKAL